MIQSLNTYVSCSDVDTSITMTSMAAYFEVVVGTSIADELHAPPVV